MVQERDINQNPNNWSEKLNSLNQELRETIKKAYSLKNLEKEQFNDISVEKDFHDNQLISFRLRAEDLVMAPEEIKMVIDDLGIDSSDEIDIQLVLGDPGGYSEGTFQLIIKPTEITDEKFGVSLSSRHNHNIYAPTRKEFDGIHQYTHTRYGRGAKLADVYEDDLRRPSTFGSHPYTVEILNAGVNWFLELVESRRKPSGPHIAPNLISTEP